MINFSQLLLNSDMCTILPVRNYSMSTECYKIATICFERTLRVARGGVDKTYQVFKVPMTRKFLLHNEKEYLKLLYFPLQRFVDEIFQFEFFVLSANYVILCITKHQKVDYKVVFL